MEYQAAAKNYDTSKTCIRHNRPILESAKRQLWSTWKPFRRATLSSRKDPLQPPNSYQ